MIIFFRLAAFAFASSLVAAFSWVFVANHGYGAGDLAAYSFYTIFFSLFLSGILNSLKPKVVFGVLVSVGVAFMFAFLLQKSLGIWFKLFSFPLALTWGVGGLATALFVFRKKLAWTLALVFLAALLPNVLSPLVHLASMENNISIEGIRIYPKSGTDSLDESRLTREEKIWLNSQHVNGTLRENFSGSRGTGDKIRVVILMDHPIQKSVLLNVPVSGSVLYLQRGEGFIQFPSKVKMGKISLQLINSLIDTNHEPDSRVSKVTNLWLLDDVNGSSGFSFDFRDN